MNQKGLIQVVILALVIIGLIVGVLLVKQTTDVSPDAKNSNDVTIQATMDGSDGSIPPIENKDGLLNSLNMLNNEDLGVLEQSVSENETDALGF